MPMSLWLKVGIICPWRKVNYKRGVVQDDTNLCACPVDLPTMTGGIFILRLPQASSVVMYMPLAHASEITMSLG